MYWYCAVRIFLVVLITNCWCAPTFAASEDVSFRLAADHYSMQRWELAAHEFARFLDQHPKHANASSAKFFLGEAYVQLGRYVEAREQFASYLKEAPQAKYIKQAIFRRGEAAYIVNDLADAKQHLTTFRKTYSADPLNAHVLIYLGGIALADQDYTAAKSLFELSQQQFPKGPQLNECKLGLGSVAEGTGDLQTAHAIYEELARGTDEVAEEAQVRHGILFFQEKEFEKAIETLTTFEKRFPSSAQRVLAFYWLAMSRSAQGNWKEAADSLHQAASLATSHPLAGAIEFAIGEAFRNQNQWLDALKHYRRVGEVDKASNWADDAVQASMQAAFALGDHELVEQLVTQFERDFPDSALHPYVLQTWGRSQVQRNNVAEGIQTLKQTLELLKGNVKNQKLAQTTRYYLALAYLTGEQYENSLEMLDKIEPDEVSSELTGSMLSMRASALIGLKQFEKAIAVLEEYTQQQPTGPDSAKCRAQLIVVRAQLGQMHDSSEVWEALSKFAPNDPLVPRAALAYATALERDGKNEEALAIYNELLEKHAASPQHLAALLGAARVMRSLKKYERAATVLSKWSDENRESPSLPDVLFSLAETLEEMQRNEAAALVFSRIARDYTTSQYFAEATIRVAESAWKNGDDLAAMEAMDRLRATELDPRVATRVLYLQGRIAANRGEWKEVGKLMKRLLEEFPDSSLCLQAEYWQAESLYRQDQLQEACERFSQLHSRTMNRQDEWCAQVLLRYAQILSQQKKWSQAYYVANQLQTRFPDFRSQYEADYVVGRYLANQGKFAESRAAYERVIQSPAGSRSETAAMAQWMIGETFFHQKNYGEAIKAYARVERLFDFDQWKAGALLQSGKCYDLQGNRQESMKLYAQVLRQFPDTPFTAEASQRLNALQHQPSAKAVKP